VTADSPTTWERRLRARLSRASNILSDIAGSAWVSGLSIITVTALVVTGLVAGFPPWWQATVSSTGALVSLLVLFSIQHATNRQTSAILLKLDELIRATGGADDHIIGLENRQLHDQARLHQQHQRHHGDDNRA
jgi:low affinity Fe/Cu permease